MAGGKGKRKVRILVPRAFQFDCILFVPLRRLAEMEQGQGQGETSECSVLRRKDAGALGGRSAKGVCIFPVLLCFTFI